MENGSDITQNGKPKQPKPTKNLSLFKNFHKISKFIRKNFEKLNKSSKSFILFEKTQNIIENLKFQSLFKKLKTAKTILKIILPH